MRTDKCAFSEDDLAKLGAAYPPVSGEFVLVATKAMPQLSREVADELVRQRARAGFADSLVVASPTPAPIR